MSAQCQRLRGRHPCAGIVAVEGPTLALVDDTAGEHVDHECREHPDLESADISDVSDPSWFGAIAVNSRSTRSGPVSDPRPAMAVRDPFDRLIPHNLRIRISRSTVQQATG